MEKIRLFKPWVGREELNNIKKFLISRGQDMDLKFINLKKNSQDLSAQNMLLL